MLKLHWPGTWLRLTRLPSRAEPGIRIQMARPDRCESVTMSVEMFDFIMLRSDEIFAQVSMHPGPTDVTVDLDPRRRSVTISEPVKREFNGPEAGTAMARVMQGMARSQGRGNIDNSPRK